MKRKHWLILLLILILGIVLRFWQLGKTPTGFYLDEAALGYNAYSIMETGKDEYGKDWPILFRSFGDFKAPIYTYLLIPIYKIWGDEYMVDKDIVGNGRNNNYLVWFLDRKKFN